MKRKLATCIFATLFCITLVEVFLRWHAAAPFPQVQDNRELWCLYRDAVRTVRNPIVIMGDSRILLGFDTDALRRAYPGATVINLSLAGANPYPFLDDLSSDPEFNGTIIASFNELNVNYRKDSHAFVEFYHARWGWHRAAQRRLVWELERRFFIVNAARHLASLMPMRKGSRISESQYVTTYPDRSRAADYSKIDLARLKRQRDQVVRKLFATKKISPAAWLQQAGAFLDVQHRLESRGGRVLWIRFPSSGFRRRLEEDFYPKEKYWDAFATLSGSAVHYLDFGSVKAFHCPDGSHIDSRDRLRYTVACVDFLRNAGYLPQEIWQ